MNVTLVPSALGVSGNEPCQYLTSFIINDSIVIDAGSIGFVRTPAEQARIRHVLLSHSHVDHVASLPILLENAFEARPDPITVHATEPVLQCLQVDIFNERLWPDFIQMGQPKTPFVRLQKLTPGRPVELEGLCITPIPVNHVVPTVGFIVEEPDSAVVFASDTGPTEEIWERANALPHLKAVFLEATFPNHLRWLADVAKHHTPATFAAEVAKLMRPVPVIVVHIKARYAAQVVRELEALALPNVTIGQSGKPYIFSQA